MSIGSYFKPSADGGMISIQSSTADLKAFEDFAKLVPKAAAAAQRRAINKTLGWLRTHIARAYPVSGGATSGKLWFGLNAIESSRIGRARQSGSGVSVAGRRYQGAFLKQVYGNKPDIWIRTASKHFNADDYPDSTVSGGGGASSGWVAENGNRFPLAKAKVSLEQARPHFDTWVKRANARLLEILRQEFNFELQKYLKGTANV